MMEKNIKPPHKGKKWLKFRHVYAFILLLLTALLAWHIVNLLILTPMRETGEAVHGSRMDEIQPIEQSWRDDAIAFGASLDDVSYVQIFWRGSPVVYFNVRVEPGTTRRYSRRAARAIVEHFIEVSDDVARQYDLQIAITRADSDVQEMRAEHHAAVERHVHEYNHSLVEDILAHAEQYPSETNVARARSNIEVFAASIIAVVDEAGLEEMRARVTALGGGEPEPLEDEDFEPMPSFGADVRQIPRSDISNFPIWGTWDNERSRVIWSQ